MSSIKSIAESEDRADRDWRDDLLDFVTERAHDTGTCEKCGSARVEVAPALVTLPHWNPTEREWSLNGSTYPMAVFVCLNCGHVNLYSASLAGVKKEQIPEE